MIATLNNLVNKVEGSVSGFLYGFGPKPVKVKKVKMTKVKCSHKRKCNC